MPGAVLLLIERRRFQQANHRYTTFMLKLFHRTFSVYSITYCNILLQIYISLQNRSIAVPVDATATVSDLEYIVRDCTPECMWVSEACEKVAREVVSHLDFDVKILIINEVEKEDIKGFDFDTSTLDQTSYDDNAIALIIYTSGTTGSPKGVMLTYKNLWTNKAGVCDEVPVFNGKRRTLMLLPVHHVLPLMGTVVAPILQGDGIVICESMQGPDIMEALCRICSPGMTLPEIW